MLTIWACIVLFFQFLGRHWRLSIALVVIVVVVSSFASWRSSQQPVIARETAVYSQNIPQEITSLPVYATPTRYYYVVSAHEEGNYMCLDDYYAFDDKWVRYNAEPLPLLKSQLQIYSK